MDISTSSTDEESPSSRLSKSNATIDLLFVNESSDLPPQPVGHRHDIRSHVRRHVARNFKQKHKGGAKTISTQRKLPLLLASRDQVQLASKFVLHHHDLPSALQPGSNSPSTLTARPERHDRNEPASPELEVLGDLGYYCNICGAQLQSPVDLTGLVHANDRRVNMTRHAWRPPLKPRLVEILGAGRVDPFLSYPVEKPDRYVHEVIDLCESPDPPYSTGHFSSEITWKHVTETHRLQL
jgi:hypothetical protein